MNNIKTRIIISNSLNPWENLALEEALLDSVQKNEAILYLWQNENTVVIGRNQNPWKECDLRRLEMDGGKLARRLSGGGAVFHDTGNLNFTFIVDRKLFDIRRQLSVVLSCVTENGINATASGRNDILADGRKFSGNAFYYKDDKAYHHGTILVDSNLENLTKYLTAPTEKIVSKGIDSVRSRVVNLKSLNNSVSIQSISDSMVKSFESEYGKAFSVIKPSEFDISPLVPKYSSWDWRFGQAPKFDISFEKRFGWGDFEICFTLRNGKIASLNIYSDALNVDILHKIDKGLIGCEFKMSSVIDSISSCSFSQCEKLIADDIISLLLEKKHVF